MAKRRSGGQRCSFGEKFAQWLAKNGTNVTRLAREWHGLGLRQRTLHQWVKEDVRVPDWGLAIIARITGIPAGYWIDETLPWPPPAQYGETVMEEISQALMTWPMEQLRELAEMARDPEDRDRTLALRRAARQRPPRPPSTSS